MATSKKNRKWILKICYVYVAALVFFSIVGDRGLGESFSLWKEGRKVDSEISILRDDIRDLRRQVENFRNHDKTIEQYAREKMNLSGSNEIQFIFR